MEEDHLDSRSYLLSSSLPSSTNIYKSSMASDSRHKTGEGGKERNISSLRMKKVQTKRGGRGR